MRIGRLPLHPILFAIYPILSVYQVNQAFVRSKELVRPVAFAFAVTFLCWLALGAATRNLRRAGLTISLAVALFYSSDWILRFFAPRTAKFLTWITSFWVIHYYEVEPRQMVPLLWVLVAALLLGIWLVDRTKLIPMNATLNLMGVILVLQPVAQIVPLELVRHRTVLTAPPLFTATRTEYRPHIFYIILDGYARADVLKEVYNWDNEPFLAKLEQQGFFVARRSTANYMQTALSLASSLNAIYLDNLVSTDSSDREPLRQRICASTVAETLRGLGYRIVAFDSGYDQSDVREAADEFWTPQERSSEFHDYLWQITPVSRLPWPGEPPRNPFDVARDRVRLVFDTLPKLARGSVPKFVFAHIVQPHRPFLFNPDGSPYENPDEVYAFDRHDKDDFDANLNGYLDQVQYLNDRLLTLFDELLRDSSQPSVIILQSDHGSAVHLDLDSLENTDVHERFSNLTAIRWPEPTALPAGLTDDISPVNIFRVVFNDLFATELPLLPVRCLYSTWDYPFDFIDVTEQVRGLD